MNDFRNVVIGDLPLGIFFGAFVVAFVAAFGLVLYRATKKADSSKDTPEQFSWSFFWRDNFMKWMLQILTIAIMIRMSSALLIDEAVFGVSFGIGLASGQFSIWTQGRQNKARD